MTKEDGGPGRFIVLTGVAEEEDGLFASHCRELGTSSCGDTAEEALQNLEDAITVHLKALVEVGDLERVLSERDISIIEGPPTRRVIDVQVPLGSTVKTYSPALHAV